MKMKRIPVDEMLPTATIDGNIYLIDGRYHLVYSYRFEKLKPAEAKAAIFSKTGLIGFNSTHSERPDDDYNPKNPCAIIRHTYNTSEGITMDELSNVKVLEEKLWENGAEITIGFDAKLYFVVSANYAEFNKGVKAASKEHLQQYVDYLIKPGEDWDSIVYFINPLTSLPYAYPGTLDPVLEDPDDDYPEKRLGIHIFIREATPLEEPTATLIFEPDEYEAYENAYSLHR